MITANHTRQGLVGRGDFIHLTVAIVLIFQLFVIGVQKCIWNEDSPIRFSIAFNGVFQGDDDNVEQLETITK